MRWLNRSTSTLNSTSQLLDIYRFDVKYKRDEKPVNDPSERERERESWGTMN